MQLRADAAAALALLGGLVLALHGDPHAPSSAELRPAATAAVSFSEEIAPIFQARCLECHGPERAEASLRLDSYEGVMAGSEFGTVIEPGDAEASILVEMIAAGDMPEEGDPVPPQELELIMTWIAEGAQNN